MRKISTLALSHIYNNADNKTENENIVSLPENGDANESVSDNDKDFDELLDDFIKSQLEEDEENTETTCWSVQEEPYEPYPDDDKTEENENERVPKVYVNGQEMDINAIDAYPMAEIISISYLDKEESLSANTGGEYGAIILQVRDINARQQFLINSMAEVIVPGYATHVEFYAPDYSVKNDKEKKDNRTTIAWIPSLQSNSLGDASIAFWSADRPSDYRIVIEGITADGELLHEELVIQSK